MKTFESLEAWRARARELFGDDARNWRFVCPVCGHVATVRDFLDAGGGADQARCECIGRLLPRGEYSDAYAPFTVEQGPCNYVSYGLHNSAPVRIMMGSGTAVCSFAFDGDYDDDPALVG